MWCFKLTWNKSFPYRFHPTPPFPPSFHPQFFVMGHKSSQTVSTQRWWRKLVTFLWVGTTCHFRFLLFPMETTASITACPEKHWWENCIRMAHHHCILETNTNFFMVLLTLVQSRWLWFAIRWYSVNYLGFQLLSFEPAEDYFFGKMEFNKKLVFV